MRATSNLSAGATYLDREERIAALREAAIRAVRRRPEIRRIVLFGSLSKGMATPRSDADLLVVIATADAPLARDRVPGVLEALSPLPCPVDLFVVTEEELERGRRGGSPLLREAMAHGIELIRVP